MKERSDLTRILAEWSLRDDSLPLRYSASCQIGTSHSVFLLENPRLVPV